VRDVLLDTCVWSDWYDAAKNAYIIKKLEREPDTRIYLSAVTLGELQYGFDVLSQHEKQELGNVIEFVHGQGPTIVDINRHVAREYGRIRAKLFEQFAPNDKKRKGLRPEQLCDPVTSLELGIQENDLWIVAQAITYGLILVTNDKLNQIREVVGDELYIENWAEGDI